MNSIDGIKTGIRNKQANNIIARKVFLSYSTEIFKDDQEREFYIKDAIASNFEIPFGSIQVAGSGKTGLSFFKDKKFEPGKSDLDISIISLPLFNKFSEEVHRLSKGYSDLTVFPIYKGYNTAKQFKNGVINSGFLNPFYMPNCTLKSKWLDFFNVLSNKHFDLFKNINGGMYASEYFFESKQEECIVQYIKNPSLYDKISS